jgi:hypothetical protein
MYILSAQYGMYRIWTDGMQIDTTEESSVVSIYIQSAQIRYEIGKLPNMGSGVLLEQYGM